MDGTQRNFNMMAEKIDRMRCLREKCDNYVRLIKLKLDESIQEQNSLLHGSAIHNRLKYLGLLNKPTSPPNTYKFDTLYNKKKDSDNKYNYLVFNDQLGIRQHNTKPYSNSNEMYSLNDYNYYKPKIREFPSTVYDDHDNSYYTPTNPKKYGKSTKIHYPNTEEYQVYYFPTSKPIAQYPRQTPERFYRRKPIKQYPQEEVPYWHTRYPKPVRVVERQSSYPAITDFSHRSTTDYQVGNNPYTPDYRAKYFPTDENIYHSFDNSSFYHDPDMKQRSYSSITRPCSPIYSRDDLYNRTQLENSSSLLEKKIRDYVWNPRKEQVEKYIVTNNVKSTYYSDFKPTHNKYQGDETYRKRPPLIIDSQIQNRKNEVPDESSYNKDSKTTSPERRLSIDDSFQSRKNNNNFLEYMSHKNKSETPMHLPKRISFDLGNEDIEISDSKQAIGYNDIDDNSVTSEHKLISGRRDSNVKSNDKRRTSILSNDNHSVPISKQRVTPSDTDVYSRRPSLKKQEKLASIGNSFESEKLLNLKNNDPLEENVYAYDNDAEIVDLDHNNDIEPNSKIQAENNKHVSDRNAYRDVGLNSNSNGRRKLSGTIEKSNFNDVDRADNTCNRIDEINVTEQRGSYREDEQNEIVSGGRKNSIKADDRLNEQYNGYRDDFNTSSNNIALPPAGERRNSGNKRDTNRLETDRLRRFSDKIADGENDPETIGSFRVDDDDDNDDTGRKTDDANSVVRDGPASIPGEREPSRVTATNGEHADNNTSYYRDRRRASDEVREHEASREYETRPERADADEKCRPADAAAAAEAAAAADERADNGDNETSADGHVEPVHDGYYYRDPTDGAEGAPGENVQHDGDERRADEGDAQYYQDYSEPNAARPGDVHADDGPRSDDRDGYADDGRTPADADGYYYGGDRGDRGDAADGYPQPPQEEDRQQPYADDRGYQAPGDGDYDNFYRGGGGGGDDDNYSGPGARPDGQYAAEAGRSDYYYRNGPGEDADGGPADGDRQYAEPEHQSGYADEERRDADYYYHRGDGSGANAEPLPPDRYGERAQQEGYADDAGAVTGDGGYYYRETDGNDYGGVPEQRYDGYTDERRAPETGYDDYAADPGQGGYDRRRGYDGAGGYDGTGGYDDTGDYRAQQPMYPAEPYEQNPDGEGYSYTDGTQSASQPATADERSSEQ